MRAETGDFKGSIDGVESDAWGRYRAEISSADTREFWACWPQVPLPYSDASPAQTCPGAFEHERLAIGDRATGISGVRCGATETANGYRSGCMPFLRLIAPAPYDAGAASTLARLAPGAEAGG